MAKRLPRITNYFGLVVSKGRPVGIGSRSQEIGSVVGIGEDFDIQQKDVPAGGTVAAWTRLADPLFDFLRISLIGQGALEIALTYDTPTSWSNLAASGTRQFTQHVTLSGAGVFTVTPWAMTSPTVHPTAVSAGSPSVLTASDRTWALLYRVQIRNPSGSAVVRYELVSSAVFGS